LVGDTIICSVGLDLTGLANTGGISVKTIVASGALKFVVVRTNAGISRTNIRHAISLRGTSAANTLCVGTLIGNTVLAILGGRGSRIVASLGV